MEDVLQLTADLAVFDTRKPNTRPEYYIVISHDNSVEDIDYKFEFALYNAENQKIDIVNIDSWTLTLISVFSYYGRAKVRIMIKDPHGISLPGIDSGGYTLCIDEKLNLNWVKDSLVELINRLRILRCFQNYRSKLDFNNLLNENPELNEYIKRL